MDVPDPIACEECGVQGEFVRFGKRVWYPLLEYLGLTKHRPYQTRHTAATLLLASGENPEWVARVLGHASTEMLFKVYSRYVPNATRQDVLVKPKWTRLIDNFHTQPESYHH